MGWWSSRGDEGKSRAAPDQAEGNDIAQVKQASGSSGTVGSKQVRFWQWQYFLFHPDRYLFKEQVTKETALDACQVQHDKLMRCLTKGASWTSFNGAWCTRFHLTLRHQQIQH